MLEGFESYEDSQQAEVILDHAEAWLEDFEIGGDFSMTFKFPKRDLKFEIQTIGTSGKERTTLSLTDKGTESVVSENVRWLEALAKAFGRRVPTYSIVLENPRTISFAKRT